MKAVRVLLIACDDLHFALAVSALPYPFAFCYLMNKPLDPKP